MATGISRQEKHGVDALTAGKPHRDPHPLPSHRDQVELRYPNLLSEAEVLRPIAASFDAITQDGCRSGANDLQPNGVVLTDNFFGLHQFIESGQKANLIYLDPPYGTGMEFHSRQLEHAYKDNRAPAAYIEFMRRRLILMREALADDGVLYLHIGHQMLFHLKVVLDEVFGAKNFRNLIIRRKCSSKNFTRNQYPNLNDYVLFYSKSATFKWNQPSEIPEQEWIEREYPKLDARGRYKLVPVHAPGTRRGETGKRWRGKLPPAGKHWQYAPSKLDELDERGEMHWSRNGNPRRKVYLERSKTVPLTDYWSKFRDAHHQSIQITGYPTEKNLEMMRVIVRSGTDEGDLVLDPFCGSGTTLHAANDLGRKWIGMDESFSAISATLNRLRHGMKPMGDYVERVARPVSPSGDLFAGQCENLASHQKATVERTVFNFLVDCEILEEMKEEVLKLASI